MEATGELIEVSRDWVTNKFKITFEINENLNQETIENIQGVKLTIKAEKHKQKRSLDANALLSGNDTEQLPETYVIFITENDVLGRNKPIYHILHSNVISVRAKMTNIHIQKTKVVLNTLQLKFFIRFKHLRIIN